VSAVLLAIVFLCSAESARSQTPERLAGEPYQSLVGTRARIRFSRGDSLLAVRLLDVVDRQPPLPGLPPDVPSGVTVFLTHGPEAFDELTGGVVPEWRAGVALPSANLMVIPAGEGPSIVDGDGARTLRHEWAHLGLHGYLGDLRIPRWFDEGYAQWASGGFDASEAWRLRVLLALDRAPAMDSLSLRWPAQLEQARTAYLLSASAVAYLLESSGERGLAIFLERWREVGSFDDAMIRTYGVTPGQFEEDWKQHVRDRYGWLLVLSHSSLFWAAMTLVLLALVAVRRRRNREKLARLRANEPPDDPAYWVDPGDGPVPPQGG
jgi:hypothetical protein